MAAESVLGMQLKMGLRLARVTKDTSPHCQQDLLLVRKASEASSLHLGGVPEKEPTVSVTRYQRAVQKREKKRISDACDALLSLSEVIWQNY